jgi:hypothetical protein
MVGTIVAGDVGKEPALVHTARLCWFVVGKEAGRDFDGSAILEGVHNTRIEGVGPLHIKPTLCPELAFVESSPGQETNSLPL